ncbi:hypothetical protein NC652_004908 [Populus alba x Populus x berolinensis]|nr:hypothetical protein NC652_004908 [Populus alba x Populus x berolinensis]
MQYSLESYVNQEPLSPPGNYPIPDMGLHGADHYTLPYNFGGLSIKEKNEMLVTTRNSLELLSSILKAETEPKPIKQVISQYEELEAGIKSREQLPESSDNTGASMLPAQLGHQNETKIADYPMGPICWPLKLNRSLQDRRPSAREKLGADFKQKMDALISEIEKAAPSLKALYQYEALREKERVVTEEFEAARMEEKQIADGYNAVKQRRGLIQLVNLVKPSTLYMRKSSNRQLGGTAYLSLENEDDPFLHGIKYTLLCPHKSVSEIWNSSLVERRLLQRCHCYSPSTASKVVATRPGFLYTRTRGRCTPQFWSSRREAWPRMVPQRSTVSKVFGSGGFERRMQPCSNTYARKGFPYSAWEGKLVRDLFLSRQPLFLHLTSKQVSGRRLQVLSNHGHTYYGYRRFSVFMNSPRKLKEKLDRNQD